MVYRKLLAAFLWLGLAASPALAQPPTRPPTAFLGAVMGPMAVTSTSSNIAFSASTSTFPAVQVINDGAVGAFIAQGNSSVVAGTSGPTNLFIAPGEMQTLAINGTNLAAITVSGTTTLRIIQWTGNPSYSQNGLNSGSVAGKDAIFGSGLDGTVTISSGSTTLARDTMYENLTISGTGQLNTNGFRIFVSGTLDLSHAPANAINSITGVDAIAAVGSTASIGGMGARGTFLPNALFGRTGVNGSIGIGAAGTGSSGTTVLTNAKSNIAGSGGASGAVAGGAGGNPPALTASNALFVVPTTNIILTTNAGGIAGYAASQDGSSGGAGAGDGVNAGGGSGGGGSSSAIGIWANVIARGTNATSGVINARGGNGGNGGTAIAGNSGGGGGGAGAGGAVVYIVAGSFTGNTNANAINISGGNGGTGGNGVGTGLGGQGGTGAQAGSAQVVTLNPPAFVNRTSATIPATPALPSTLTGSNGSTGTALFGTL